MENCRLLRLRMILEIVPLTFKGLKSSRSSSSECETDLTVTSEIAIGFEGADAFEVWLKNGNEGKTYEDYIAFSSKTCNRCGCIG